MASQLGADFGYMILFGLIAAVPALILAGPLFGELISKVVDVPLPADAQSSAHDDGQNLPSFGLAMGLIGLPLLLIGLKTIVGRFVEAGTPLHGWLGSSATLHRHHGRLPGRLLPAGDPSRHVP